MPGGNDKHGVVEHVGRHGHPYRTAPQQQVAEICAEQHARYEAENLHVHGAEANRDEPYCEVYVHAARDEQALEAATEKQFLGDTGSDADYQYVENQGPGAGVGHHGLERIGGHVLEGAKCLLEAGHRFGQRYVVVPVDYGFLCRD